MKKILTKIALALLLLGILHTTLSYFLDLRFSRVDWIPGRLKGDVDIVYMGDSVIGTVYGTDEDRATLDSMLARALLGRKVTSLSFSALGTDMFEAICDYMRYKDVRPVTAVIPINLRSFSPIWTNRFPYQFSEEKSILANPFLYRLYIKPLKIFKYNKDFIDQKTLESKPVFDGPEQIGTVASIVTLMGKAEQHKQQDDSFQISDELKSKSIAVQYLYELDENQDRMQALVRTAEKLRTMGTQAVFYLTPINYQLADDYYDRSAQGRIRANAELIKRTLKKHNVTTLDLTFSLSRDKFEAIRLFQNEHLQDSGRLFLADTLANYILNRGY